MISLSLLLQGWTFFSGWYCIDTELLKRHLSISSSSYSLARSRRLIIRLLDASFTGLYAVSRFKWYIDISHRKCCHKWVCTNCRMKMKTKFVWLIFLIAYLKDHKAWLRFFLSLAEHLFFSSCFISLILRCDLMCIWVKMMVSNLWICAWSVAVTYAIFWHLFLSLTFMGIITQKCSYFYMLYVAESSFHRRALT